jgi:nitrogen fixation NifU-like protein
MDSLYAQEILDHYKHPRNFGQLDEPDIHVDAVNPLCGDKLAMDLHIKDGLEDLAGMTRDDILEMLGVEVSYARMKCATLSLGLLRLACAQAGISIAERLEDE